MSVEEVLVMRDAQHGLVRAHIIAGPIPGIQVVEPERDEDGHRSPPVDLHKLEWAQAVQEGRTCLGFTEYREMQLWLTLDGG